MRVTSKEQFDAIQYTSIEVIRDFLASKGEEEMPITSVSGGLQIGTRLDGCGLVEGDWLVLHYTHIGDPNFQAFSDESFKEHYQPVEYRTFESLIPKIAARLSELAQEEKDFIAQADIRSSERTESSARIKQQILDKL